MSSVASQGLRASLDALGLADVVGKSAMAVLAAIADRIAPAGNTVEEAAARRSANDVIEKLYRLCDEAGGDLGTLEQMTEDDVRQAIHESAASYVYHRWAEELGLRIEQGAVSAASAVALERQMRNYIRERVTNLLGDRDPLRIDWAGKEGSAITKTIYEEAYRLLEVGE